MPKRERKRPKAVRAWARVMCDGKIDLYGIFPTAANVSRFARSQRVLIVPLEGKVLVDGQHELTEHERTTGVIQVCTLQGVKRCRVLVLEEKP